jgi:mono/diheme cytochrome c family protein
MFVRAGSSNWALLVGASIACAAIAGCSQKMEEQPRLEPYETSEFFADGLAMQPPMEGTVARGEVRLDAHFFEGRVDGRLAESFPDEVDVDERLVRRGRERFEAFCSHCHGFAGDGDGMVVRRGFPDPPSYHVDRLRRAPVGHVYDVITNGLGRMPRFSDRIPPRDRWAIVAYVRALQVSRHAEVDEALRERIDREESRARDDAGESDHE